MQLSSKLSLNKNDHFQHPIVGDGIKWKDPKKDLGLQGLKRLKNNLSTGGKE